MKDQPFDEQVAYLRRYLRQDELPGAAAQQVMMPAHRDEPSPDQVAELPCREAGVMALVYPENDRGALILTVRHDDLPDHGGQVSLPGGQLEPDETRLEAALREVHEEIGVDPSLVDVLGGLTPLYIPPSGFCVYPFVGALPEEPNLKLLDAEVQAVLSMPLADLLSPSARVWEERMLRGEPVRIPFFAVGEYKVWGATAMILAELMAVFPAPPAE